MKKRILLVCLTAALLTSCGGKAPTPAPTGTPGAASEAPKPVPTAPAAEQTPGAPSDAPVLRKEGVELATDEMKKAGSKACFTAFSVEGPGWEALGSALEQWNAQVREELQARCEAGEWNAPNCTAWYEGLVQRCDDRVVSIYYNTYEGESFRRITDPGRAVTFDARTGKRLEKLEDLPGLGTEYDWGTGLNDSIVNALSWELGQVEAVDKGAYPLADSYQDALMECFWDEEKAPVWGLDKRGLWFLFRPGAVAPADRGVVEVWVDYDYAAGKLGEKYYPGKEALLKEMAGEWVQVAGESEGEVWSCSAEGSGSTLTVQPDGKAVLDELYRDDKGQWVSYNKIDMTLELKEGGFWRGFPALEHLEYCAWHTEDYDVTYSFALDGDRLYVWYEHAGEYIATVSCYCRAEDPGRFFPRCLEGTWVIHRVSADDGWVEYPEYDTTWYSELHFTADEGEAVPSLWWDGAGGEGLTYAPERNDGPLDDSSPADWFLTFDRDYGDGATSAYNAYLTGENVLVVEDYYRLAPDALPMVMRYTFWRMGTVNE